MGPIAPFGHRRIIAKSRAIAV